MGGKSELYLSLVTGCEWVVLEGCSLICINQNNLPYWAESDTTIPLVVLSKVLL